MPNKKFETLKDYIASFPTEIQSKLIAVQNTIKQTIPDAIESISYNIPAYKLSTRHSIYFAAFKNYISMYPMYGLEQIQQELNKYRAKGTKDTIHFVYNDPIPFDLIKKIAILKSQTK
jgi:uncharacterized protein YdhG (YjbR/CyaY superfamily)